MRIRFGTKVLHFVIITLGLILYLIACSPGTDKADLEIIDLDPVVISANTEFKPQSKVWKHDNSWWMILPDMDGTHLWRLEEKTWVRMLRVADWTNSHADAKPDKDLVHVLLFRGENSGLVSLQYDQQSRNYRFWQDRPEISPITYHPETEVATIDMDSKARLWSAFDTVNEVMVMYSDPPYTQWSGPVTLASGIYKDDICALTALPEGQIAVLWSNQNSKRFGFRVHRDGEAAENWSDDEQPASQSALDNIGDGMADDHLNFCIGRDGTLYAAVKTSYDMDDYPLIGFLRRHPNGQWDDLLYIDDEGTRGIICLNERTNELMLFYTLHHKIQVRTSDADMIHFGDAEIAIDAPLNHAAGPKHNVTDDLIIVASAGDTAKSVLIRWDL